METLETGRQLMNYHSLYRNDDLWHLHLSTHNNPQRRACDGTSESQVIAVTKSAPAATAALETLCERFSAWAYNPARHQFIPGKRIRLLASSLGALPHSFWSLYNYASQSFGPRSWRHSWHKDGEQLEIVVSTGMNSLHLDKTWWLNCVLVTARWRRGEEEQSMRFWLDEYINARGALSRKVFEQNHPALVAIYGRLRSRSDSASLLGTLAAEYADIVMGLRQRKVARSRYWDYYLRGEPSLLKIVAEELETACLSATPYKAGIKTLTSGRLHPVEFFTQFEKLFGSPEKALKLDCSDGCDGTMKLVERSLVKHGQLSADGQKLILNMIRELGYRCSCRFLAGQSLLGNWDAAYSHKAIEDSYYNEAVARARRAGCDADAAFFRNAALLTKIAGNDISGT